MKILRRRIRDGATFHRAPYTIRQQLILFSLAVIIIPYCITGMIVYKAYIRSMHAEAEQYMLQYATQIVNNIDVAFDQINELTLRPYYDASLMDVLRKRADDIAVKQPFMRSGSISAIQLFLMSAGLSRREFDSVSIITADGYMLSGMDGSHAPSTLPKEMAAMNFRLTPYGFYFLPPSPSSLRAGPPRMISSIIRELHDPGAGRVLGYIRIDLNDRIFENMISKSTSKYGDLLYIANAFGDIFYPVEAQGQNLPFANAERAMLHGVEYTVSKHASREADLYLYQLATDSAIIASAGDLSHLTVWVASFVATAAVFISILYSYNLTRPLHDLAGKMHIVENGDFTVRVFTQRRDEIARLCEGFNRMVERIHLLIKENYQTKLLRQEAEYKALQRQIDPHFLYNTLELINMMALERREYGISDTVTSLGRMLRYTVRNDRPMCSLEEELRFVSAYFQILKMRNGERFNWEIECSSRYHHCAIPRLTLQPLVENAFLHGIKADCGLISVHVSETKGMLAIRVEDDGSGMDEAALQALRQSLDKRQDGGQEGHALSNINQRLALTFADHYSIQVDSSKNHGTRFIIVIPMQRLEPDIRERRK